MAEARTCYDHLAGRLGVAITDAMIAKGLVEAVKGFSVTNDGLRWLDTELGLGDSTIKARRRPLVLPCQDWTERRPHIAGLAGAALCRHFFEQGWIVRMGSQRAVRLQPRGADALRSLLGIQDFPENV